MKNLVRITNAINVRLSKKEQVREQALAMSRDINRQAKELIFDIHHQRDVKKKLDMLKRKVRKLNTKLKQFPDMKNAGFTQNALQEYAEAAV